TQNVPWMPKQKGLTDRPTASRPALVAQTMCPPQLQAKRPKPFVWVIVSGTGILVLLLCVCGGTVAWFAGVRSKPAGSLSSQSPDYHPLKQGARWEYDFEFQVGVLPVQKGTASRRIDGEERINGKTFVKLVMVTTGIPGFDPETRYFRTDDSGTYEL